MESFHSYFVFPLAFGSILSLLVKYLVIFQADPCNKSYIFYFPTICNHSYGSDTQERSFVKGEGDEFSYGRGKRQRRPCHLWDMLRVIMTSAIAKKGKFSYASMKKNKDNLKSLGEETFESQG